MAIRKSSSSGIPFGNTAGRPANPGSGQLYSNGQIGRLELYTDNGWQNIVQETPGIASISGTYNESAGSGTFVISGTNFVTGGIAYAVGTNAVEYQATSSTTNSIVQMTAVFSALSPAYEPYDVKVLNPSNLFGLLPDAFYINDSPIWSTSTGSLGSYNGVTSIQLSATDDESNTLTYSVVSGSLPTGLSLSSAGLISGTITATPATYTFTVGVSDGNNTVQTRSFSITVPLVLTGGTLTSDSTYYYRTFTATGNLVSNTTLSLDLLMVGGGGGSTSAGPYAGGWGGGGGAGGLVYKTSYSLSPNTYSVVIGAGGAATSGTVNNGVNTTFNSLIAYGGGGGGAYGIAGNNGGSGGGGGGDVFALGGSATQSSSATGGFGNAGGNSYDPAPETGGGGGGAGAAGAAGGTNTAINVGPAGGAGGAGKQYTEFATATSTGRDGGYYAGGGGGGNGTMAGNYTGGLGGVGGGGAGSSSYSNNYYQGDDGYANTGGGAGSGNQGNGNSGGSGIVIIRYTKASVGG